MPLHQPDSQHKLLMLLIDRLFQDATVLCDAIVEKHTVLIYQYGIHIYSADVPVSCIHVVLAKFEGLLSCSGCCNNLKSDQHSRLKGVYSCLERSASTTYTVSITI
eukprot:12320-Heterococcus_DN1.PRE.15